MGRTYTSGCPLRPEIPYGNRVQKTLQVCSATGHKTTVSSFGFGTDDVVPCYSYSATGIDTQVLAMLPFS